MTCEMCEAAPRIDAGDDPWAVARLTTGRVGLCRTQYFRGYTFFVAKQCVAELHELDDTARAEHLHDMAEVAHAVFRAFSPRKLNYEALGNGVAHLHWHLIPRHSTDPFPRGPAWEDHSFLRQFWNGGDDVPIGDAERDTRRVALLRELERADVEIEAAFVR